MALEYTAPPAPVPTPPLVISGTPYYHAMFNALGDNVEDSSLFETEAGGVNYFSFESPDTVTVAIIAISNVPEENSINFNMGAQLLQVQNNLDLAICYLGENNHNVKLFSDGVNYYAGLEIYWEDGLGATSNVNIKNDNGLSIDGGSGVPLKWPLADGAAGQVMKTDGAGTLAFQYPFMALGNIPLTEYTFVGGIFEDLASGSNDLYTVPAGKKAVVLEPHRLYNNTGGSVSSYSQIKISGTYYRLGLAISQGANSGGSVTFNNSIVLNAGESYSINTGSTGQSVFISIIEFSDAVPVKRIGSFAIANGDNTLYTVPANKQAALITFSSPGLNAGASTRMVNTSGGSVTYTPYSIESGQAKAAKYQNEAATAVANNAQSTISFSPQLREGDFLLINSTSGTAGQTIFGTIMEIDV